MTVYKVIAGTDLPQSPVKFTSSFIVLDL